MAKIHKYSGAGNTFVVLDGRTEDVSEFRTPERIKALCTQYSTDGLMILSAVSACAAMSDGRVSASTCPIASGMPESPSSVMPEPPSSGMPDPSSSALPGHSSPVMPGSSSGLPGHSSPGMPGSSPSVMPDLIGHLPFDFSMEFFNPDGTGGMMCGNGGRCIVAFADSLGIRPASGSLYRFLAPDGPHVAEILSRDCGRLTVRLKMIDVKEFYPVLDGWFVNTGTRHFVKFVPDADAVDVDTEGRRLRWDDAFAPIGANVNFVSVDPDGALRVRTFEKGVEGETLACGTGITASAIAAYLDSRKEENSFPGQKKCPRNSFIPFSTIPTHFVIPDLIGNPVSFEIQARQDRLSVEFTPGSDHFTDVYLTGPAEEL